MDPEIQSSKLLKFDQTSNSWVELTIEDQINELPTSLPTSSETLPPFVIATWNIWEDDRFAEYRHHYILQKLFEKEQGEGEGDPFHRPPFDVITLQEVTPDFFSFLLAHPPVRADWILTDLTHQLDICPNPFGTVILIRKGLLGRGLNLEAAVGFHEFENTRMQRGLNFVELSFSNCVETGASPRPIVRIGTSHFESHPEDKRKRREQFEVSASILTSRDPYFFDKVNSPPTQITGDQSESPTELIPAILTGDCNICSYDELDPLLNPEDPGATPAFIDAFLDARPIGDKNESLIDHDNEASPSSKSSLPLTSYPTFGVTIPNRKPLFGFRGASLSNTGGKKKGNATIPKTRRLDYIFTHGFAFQQNQNQESSSPEARKFKSNPSSDSGSSESQLRQSDNNNRNDGVDDNNPQLEAGLFGDGPVCDRTQAEDEESRDGRVYASDHLGVWVRVRPLQ